jgi:prephenate dehydrogenase
MKIFMIGLGLMGGSYAEGLKKTGHDVYGYDANPEVMKQAITANVINPASHLSLLEESDLIILALYPKDNVEFIKAYGHHLVKNQVITDLSGTKAWMMHEIEPFISEGVSYTSHHPMAGREKNGFHARDVKMFEGANFIIVTGAKSKSTDIDLLKSVANDLKFGKITVTDANTHDELIAFTSQLTHALAVALMHSDHLTETKKATGDSFRDLTRIAKINEVMWSELFLENKEALIKKINDFNHELNLLKKMIENDEFESLKTYLKEAKEKRKAFDTD